MSAFRPQVLNDPHNESVKRLAAASAVVVGALLLGGVVGLRAGQEEVFRFDTCRWEQDTLVLEWFSGPRERVSVTVDAREGGEVTATLARDGLRGMERFPDQARFASLGGPTEVRYEDGTSLDCQVTQ